MLKSVECGDSGSQGLSLGRIRRMFLGVEEGKGGHFSEALDVGFQGGVKFAQGGLNFCAFRRYGTSTQFLDVRLGGHRRKQDVIKGHTFYLQESM